MPEHPAPPTDEPWRDADGTPIPLHCWVEQIAVDQDHRALPSWLPQRGQVIDRSAGMLYVIFNQAYLIHDYLIVLPPHLVRVLTAPEARHVGRQRQGSR